MRIAILGGYGNAGRAIARLLAHHAAVDVLILGRDGERAGRAAADIEAETGAHIQTRQVDATALEDLKAAVHDVHMTVVASSTMHAAGKVAEAILEADTDYFDVNLSSPAKIAALRALEARVSDRGRCFITDGGVHPGVPGALVRWAAEQGPLRAAAVAARFDIDWSSLRFSKETGREFVRELLDFDPAVLKGGRWRRGTRFSRTFDLGPPSGRTTCVPMCMEEVRELPGDFPDLADLGFYVAGFGAAIDYFIMPLAFAMARASPKFTGSATRVLTWGLRRFGSGRSGAVLVLEAGSMDGREFGLTLSHPDVYVCTAVPVVAALLQYIDGRRPAGLWTQASYVDPVRFLDDMARLGLEVSSTVPPSGGDTGQ